MLPKTLIAACAIASAVAITALCWRCERGIEPAVSLEPPEARQRRAEEGMHQPSPETDADVVPIRSDVGLESDASLAVETKPVVDPTAEELEERLSAIDVFSSSVDDLASQPLLNPSGLQLTDARRRRIADIVADGMKTLSDLGRDFAEEQDRIVTDRIERGDYLSGFGQEGVDCRPGETIAMRTVKERGVVAVRFRVVDEPVLQRIEKMRSDVMTACANKVRSAFSE